MGGGPADMGSWSHSSCRCAKNLKRDILLNKKKKIRTLLVLINTILHAILKKSYFFPLLLVFLSLSLLCYIIVVNSELKVLLKLTCINNSI